MAAAALAGLRSSAAASATGRLVSLGSVAPFVVSPSVAGVAAARARA